VELGDKVCVVTGGASGIGRAAAVSLAAKGAKVVFGDVNEKGGEETAAIIAAAGGDAVFAPCDVSREEEAGRLIDLAVERFGTLNVLFNNAGVNPLEGNVVDIAVEEWHRVLRINLDGIFYCCRRAVPVMRRGGGGSIINTASPGSFKGWKNNVAYLSSKGAVMSLTRALAMDHAQDGIRVNALVPGLIMTGIGEEFLAAQPDAEAVRAGIPLGRFGQPEDVAPLVVHLASDSSAFSTGAAFYVDGGELAG
jgi:meso-butanediol dehydrogenase / (S,S)-butanediol dehydrogenase / diacetyl reductase